MRSGTRLPRTASVLVHGLVAAAAWADGTYQFTINSSASSLQSTITVGAPTTGTLIGDYDAATNPTGTRTKPGLFGTFGSTENVAVPVTVAMVISGNNTTHPAGGFVLSLDPEGAEARLSGLSLDMLGAGAFAITATANVNWNSFRERSPTCIVPGGITIPIPLGQATVTQFTAEQGAAEAAGTLVSTGEGTFTVAIPVDLEVTIAASFLGQELPPTPQSIPVVFAATVTLDGNGGAEIAADLEGFEVTQQQAGPIGDPFDLPFTEPVCQGSLMFTLQLQGLNVSSTSSAALVAAGTKRPPPICPCDWNHSGGIDVPDIFAFLSSWFANESRADFDGSGGVGVPDIFAFLSCWFARPGGCA